ncbi:hypothetical protein Harman_41730 [Haloarcula mannanilytica]|uniref:Uncharacterized protein n=1 Tax=Haloarcula mannanilytica TaxID=2509225 RepID=A0A4C2ENP9_9EURY|nr:hypothetical protein Harman_41730 [Haloarcula mannanilytica]
MAFCGITDRLQDIPILDHIIKIIAAGYHARYTAITGPQTVPVRNLLPLIYLLMICIDIMTLDPGKLLYGFIQSI